MTRAWAGTLSTSTAGSSRQLPSYVPSSTMPDWANRAYGQRVDEFYGVPPYGL